MNCPPRTFLHVLRVFLLLAVSYFTSRVATASVELNPLFGDHMVLQAGMKVPVWGTAKPGERVTVRFAGQKESAKADGKGRWSVELLPMAPSSEPRELKVGRKRPIILKDVLVGEVWVCAGQSNMERQLGPRSGQKPLENWEQEVASANYPTVRHFEVERNVSDKPLARVKGRWVVCSPETAANFAAVGYYFGRDLAKQLGVPVGLIHTAVGGTPAEAWTSREALQRKMPELLARQSEAAARHPAALKAFKKAEPELLAAWEKATAEAAAAGTKLPPRPAPPKNPALGNNRNSGLFNAMVVPLIPFAIRGVIWYQGENNAGRAKEYQTLFPLLIADWRKRWGQGEFPFLFVQIAPFKSQTPEIREAQLLTWKKTPRTAMTVTVDIGDAEDIHPTRKEPVGQRLALAARAIAYGEAIEYSGPVFESVRFDGPQATVHFTHAGGGLAARGGDLRGFTLAGEDGSHFPAKAEIRGADVILTSESVPRPAAVRYGWANVPDVNLFNSEGLPASPFRTDAP